MVLTGMLLDLTPEQRAAIAVGAARTGTAQAPTRASRQTKNSTAAGAGDPRDPPSTRGLPQPRQTARTAGRTASYGPLATRGSRGGSTSNRLSRWSRARSLVLAPRAPDGPDEPVERILDPPHRHVDVGDPDLRLGVTRMLRGRSPGRRLIVGVHPLDEPDLRQPDGGHRISWRLRLPSSRTRPLPRRGRRAPSPPGPRRGRDRPTGPRALLTARRTGLRPAGVLPVAPHALFSPPGPPPAPAAKPSRCASAMTCSIHWRTCGSGTAPTNPGTSWPPIATSTIGMLSTRSAALSCGLASVSILARIQRPAASAASFSSTGLSCLHGPHHSAQRSMITGTESERSSTSVPNVSSVTSMTAPCPATGGQPPASPPPGPPAGVGPRAASLPAFQCSLACTEIDCAI